MAFTKMTDDLDIIAKYPDEPYEEEGFTSTAFKAIFDQGAKLCKDAINRLIEEMENSENGGAANISYKRSESVPADNVQAAVEAVEIAMRRSVAALREYLLGQMQDVTQGSVADGSINENKLAEPAVKEPNIYDNAVTEPKIRDDAVTEPKIKNGAVKNEKIPAGELLEDVTGSVTISSNTSHDVQNHLKFLFCRAFGMMFVSGYVDIATTYDFDINAECRIDGYLPTEKTCMPLASTHTDVGHASVTFEANNINFKSDYTDTMPATRRVYLNGYYPCSGSGTEA